MLGNCPERHREYFTVLMLTGMRPTSEAGALTAAHLDFDKKRATFHRHKNAKKTGKPRHVYFPPAAWEIVSKRAAEHPAGPLFRTTHGRAIDGHSGGQYLRLVFKRVGVKPSPSTRSAILWLARRWRRACRWTCWRR